MGYIVGAEKVVIHFVPITDRVKSWLLDNMPSGLWKVTVARGQGFPIAVKHARAVEVALMENGFILGEDYWEVKV